MTILRILLLALAGGPAVAAQVPVSHTLLPVPASVNLTSARLRLDSSFTVELTGIRTPRLERAVTRAIVRLEGRIAKALSRQYAGTGRQARLVLNVKATGFATPDLEEDESYSLTVSD